MMTENELVLATDLKQWWYCPRIVYYRQTMGAPAQPTYKMEEGKAAQEMIESLELRRSLKRYGLDGARRRLGLWLRDEELGLAGKVDMVIEAETEAAVVDFKLTADEPRENHRLQLGAYALLVERALGLPVKTGFFYRIPDSRLFAVAVNEELRQRILEALAAVRDLMRTQWCPEPTPYRKRCAECEYANFCADIW
jgi:CRISPR-associated exonuclease Cas4